jgi:hypothetical protein
VHLAERLPNYSRATKCRSAGQGTRRRGSGHSFTAVTRLETQSLSEFITLPMVLAAWGFAEVRAPWHSLAERTESEYQGGIVYR